jgi:hypothetical protein
VGIAFKYPFSVSMPTRRTPSVSTHFRTMWENSPGEATPGSTCWTIRSPEAIRFDP